MIQHDQPLPTAEAIECTHCSVRMTESPRSQSRVRYFCCPRCGRWQSTMYAHDVLRRHAGARFAQPAAEPSPSFDRIKARMDAWNERLDSQDPYAVLEVSPRASADQVRDRYRELAMRHHPDRGGDPAAMRRLNDAYERIRMRARRS